MTVRKFVVIVGGKNTQIQSDQETVTFQGLTVGTRALTDAGSGVLDTGGSQVNLADGTSAGQAASKGQLDAQNASLSASITAATTSLQGQMQAFWDSLPPE